MTQWHSSQLCGWLLINKPSNMSSAQCLNRIKWRLFKELGFLRVKIGHAGTLDPFATGLLLVGVGRATKLMKHAIGLDKQYVFEVKWGAFSDTDDITGNIINTVNAQSVVPTIDAIINILPTFIGEVSQIPPKYSAIHVGGRRAYAYARAGVDVTLSCRKVMIYDLRILDHDQNFGTTKMVLHCGSGCYVRSIARDLGQLLGVGCYVSSLCREKIGSFLVENAVNINHINGDVVFCSNMICEKLIKV